jgi:type II secretory pathway component PulM
MEHHNRQRALRELLVQAWRPLLERTREPDALLPDRRPQGWRHRQISRDVAQGAAAPEAVHAPVVASAGGAVAPDTSTIERDPTCFAGP